MKTDHLLWVKRHDSFQYVVFLISEPFQWFDQLSEERRTNLLKSITAAVSNTINGWTGLTEIAQQFGLTETQIKQAYSYAQASDHDKHPTSNDNFFIL